jgi:hypothetical protein
VTVTDPEIFRAYKHSSGHREEILDSVSCGCFHCCRIYGPGEIRSWIDEHDGVGMTALCPRCGIDSVIGSASGYPITADFLLMMRKYYFSASQ